MSSTFTADDVAHIAKLAHIPVTDEEKKKLAKGFTTVLGVLDVLKKIDVSGVASTHQVTGVTNVFRVDEVDEKRMFTQEQALANAPFAHDGYFMVKQVIEQQD